LHPGITGGALLQAAAHKQGRTALINTILTIAAIVLLLVLYAPVVTSLIRQWLDDSNYRHGILIPLVSALLLWKRRDTLRETGVGGRETLGLLLMFAAAGLLITGTAAAENFAMRISLPLMILGAVLFLKGWDFTRVAGPPLLLLLLMVPLPYIIYYKITFPMQLLSAKLSAALLTAMRVSVIRKGNILMLPGYTLEVVAACSGLRSLMTMFTLAVVFAFFSDMSKTRKFILVLLSVPVAIAANTVRLVVTALGALFVGPGFADGTLHEASGIIVFMAGFLMLLLCAGILRWTQYRQKK
jgi:exosortase